MMGLEKSCSDHSGEMMETVATGNKVKVVSGVSVIETVTEALMGSYSLILEVILEGASLLRTPAHLKCL